MYICIVFTHKSEYEHTSNEQGHRRLLQDPARLEGMVVRLISLLKHAAMICELEEILNRPVDIVQEKMLRPRVRESINQDKKLIYERAH